MGSIADLERSGRVEDPGDVQGLRGTLDIRAMLLTSRRSSWINDPGNASSLARLESDWVEDPGDALSPERLKSIGVEDP